MKSKKILITTIQPVSGGVPSMLKVIVDYLRQKDYQITLAYYQPYSVSPQLSVPALALLKRKPSIEKSTYYGCETVGLGCWLPELEFTHNWLNSYWKELIDQYSVHMMVSGSCLAAYPYLKHNTPFFAWTATDWLGDRQDRVKEFPLLRQLFDTLLVKPITKKIEKKIISTGNLIALSSYTQSELNSIVDRESVTDVLAMPIDTDFYAPKQGSEKTYRVGFVGRFSDPRKNIRLLLKSVALIADRAPAIEVLLIGDIKSEKLDEFISDLAIGDKVTTIKYMSRQELAESLPSLDVFVLPSFQEGLCIAAMEAMSCGVPVVSTRCGGPEMFVKNGENGVLVDFDEREMSDAILQLLMDDELRQRYGRASRAEMVNRFSKNVQETLFWQLFEQYQVSQTKLN